MGGGEVELAAPGLVGVGCLVGVVWKGCLGSAGSGIMTLLSTEVFGHRGVRPSSPSQHGDRSRYRPPDLSERPGELAREFGGKVGRGSSVGWYEL